MPNIDHLVYAVPNLQEAIDHLEQQFGVRPIYGGRHLQHGTHNALLHLGHECYFELIAPDPENTRIEPPRWMGVDLIQTPRLTRWAIRPDDLSKDVQRIKKINPGLAKTTTGQRAKTDGTMLEWEMSIPLAFPEVEVIPFLLDWKASVHPTVGMEQHCRLLDLRMEHPEPDAISILLEALKTEVSVSKGPEPGIIATLATPNGQIVIR